MGLQITTSQSIPLKVIVQVTKLVLEIGNIRKALLEKGHPTPLASGGGLTPATGRQGRDDLAVHPVELQHGVSVVVQDHLHPEVVILLPALEKDSHHKHQ